MRTYSAVLALVAMLLLPAASLAGAAQPAKSAPPVSRCNAAQYGYSGAVCYVFGSSGNFTLSLPPVGPILTGKTAPARHGSRVILYRTTRPCRISRGVGFKVIRIHSIPPLFPIGHSKLYKYVTRKGQCLGANAITNSGLFVIVLKR